MSASTEFDRTYFFISYIVFINKIFLKTDIPVTIQFKDASIMADVYVLCVYVCVFTLYVLAPVSQTFYLHD